MRTAAHWLKMPGLGALHRQRGVGLAALLMTRDGDHANPMTISWTMVIDFTPILRSPRGSGIIPSRALRKHRECVIAIPAVDLRDKVVGIGTCSMTLTDKRATRF